MSKKERVRENESEEEMKLTIGTPRGVGTRSFTWNEGVEDNKQEEGERER